MAPVSTMVFPVTPFPRTAAVCSMESVPCVMTMRVSGVAAARSRISLRSASVMSRLSIIMRVSRFTWRWQRPSLSMSPMWVFWKNRAPLSSLYSLSKVPPVANTLMAVEDMTRSITRRPRYSRSIPMRGARWLLLLAMVAIVGTVGLTYRAQKKILRDQAPAKPKALPPELNFSAENYHLRKSGKDGTLVEIWAKDFKQVKDSSRVELTGVELRLFLKQGDTYDLIKSAAATFFAAEDRLYSEGDVEITLGVPEEGESQSKLVSIRSSGVNFDTNTGKADTDRACSFVFRYGDGKSTGAFYDPTTHELVMKKDVEVHWKSPGANASPMKIEGTSMAYHEATSEIWLKPWGRLTRAGSVVEGYDSVIHLQDQAIRKIETNRAHGSDDYPNRKLAYAADGLWIDFN